MSGMTLSRLRAPATIDDLLNYRLMRLLAVSSAPVIRLCEGRYGISRREWRLVALLAHHGALSPSALADEADLDRARTSRAIGALLGKRLVERAAQPGDRRRARVQLSPAGRALHDELFPQVADFNRRLVSVLDDAAADQLLASLDALSRQAQVLNRAVAIDVQADRRHGGSRKHWVDEGLDDAAPAGRAVSALASAEPATRTRRAGAGPRIAGGRSGGTR